jgi:hypothetical protein
MINFPIPLTENQITDTLSVLYSDGKSVENRFWVGAIVV